MAASQDGRREVAVLHDPIGRLTNLLEQRPMRRLVIGLAGLPGAGKSTLARQMEQSVNSRSGARSMLALGMDGFHLTRAALAAFPDPDAALKRRGAPWTFDPQALGRALRALREPPPTRQMPTVFWPGFEHGVGDPVPAAIAVAPEVRLILVEGLYLLHRQDGWELQGLMDQCWYLDVDLPTALERLVLRHMDTRGLMRQQAVARIAGNDLLNAEIVLRDRHYADWLVQDHASDVAAKRPEEADL